MEHNYIQENKQENIPEPAPERGLEFCLSEQLKQAEKRLRDLKNILETTIESNTAELNRTRQELEIVISEARKYAEDIVNTVREPLIVLDHDMKIASANRSFYAAFHARPEEVEGRSILDLPCCPWEMTELRTLLESILPEHKSIDDYEISIKVRDDGYRTVLVNARQIYRGGAGQQLILLAMEDITERKMVEEKRIHLAALVESASEAIVSLTKDLNGVIHTWNRGAESVYGYSAEEAIGQNISFLVPADYPNDIPGILDQIKRGKPVENHETVRMRKDGAHINISLNIFPIRDAEGSIIGASIIGYNITERKRKEEQEREAKQLNDAFNIINNTIHSTLNLDEIMRKAVQESGAILKVDAIAISLLEDGSFTLKYGYNIPEEFIGAQVGPERFKSATYVVSTREIAVFNDAYNDDRLNQEDIRELGVRSLVAVPLISRGYVLGAISFYSESPFYFTDSYVDFAQKISASLALALDNARLYDERKQMEEDMRHMAHHDALTDLPNRRLLLDIVRLETAQARRHKSKMALLLMDLDRFKEVNDTFGHEAGDLLLKEVAVRMRAAVRESDTVSRTGGDEFNIILADIVKVEDISDIARKIVGSFRRSFSIAGHELHMTTSIGISVYPDDSDDIDSLFRYADMAMYHAKEKGRNTFQFYNPEINVRSLEKMRLEGMLRQTIARGELVVYYQPQVNVQTRQVVCAEALVRWSHPKLGLLEPKQFILMAEDTGFITAIDEWVMRTACGQVRVWLDGGLSIRVTANLSAREFHNPELTKRITQILSDTGIPPDCLDIEITESLAMSNIERTISHLRELADMGVHISIDDFGTGYSSLNYLKRLPIQKLKIDKSFIRDIAVDPDDRSIISAVTSMAHNMAITVLAEGVETEDQFSFLHEAHCDEAQGYLFSRPLPAEEFREFMAANR